MPALNFANPLHTFGNEDTWTATQDCYLIGSFIGGQGFYLSIDGKTVETGASSGLCINIPLIKIKQGQVIKLTGERNVIYDFVYALKPL